MLTWLLIEIYDGHIQKWLEWMACVPAPSKFIGWYLFVWVPSSIGHFMYYTKIWVKLSSTSVVDRDRHLPNLVSSGVCPATIITQTKTIWIQRFENRPSNSLLHRSHRIVTLALIYATFSNTNLLIQMFSI